MNVSRPFQLHSAVTPWCFALIAVLAGAKASHAQTPREFPIFGLQFSPDGKYLAASTSPKEPPGAVVIWNVNDWRINRVYRSPKGFVDVDFSRDGTQLALAGRTGVAEIIDANTGKSLHTLKADASTVYSIAFSPDGRLLASAGDDPRIKLWNLSTGELLRTFTGHRETVFSVAISPDGTSLLSGSADQEARLWNLESGQVKHIFKPSSLITRRVAFSPDGKFFLACSYGGEVRIRETATTRLRAVLRNGTNCADITADNRLVATAGHSTTAEVFAVDLHDAATEEQQRIAAAIERLRDDSYAVRESAAKEIVRIGLIVEPQLLEATKHDDAEVRVRSRQLLEIVLSPEPIARLPGHRGDVEVVSFAPNGKLVATACRGGDIKVWDTSTFSEIRTLTIPAEIDVTKSP